jgi:uracil-DNA glycosylase
MHLIARGQVGLCLETFANEPRLLFRESAASLEPELERELEAQLEPVEPNLMVCLGATAAQTQLGSRLEFLLIREKFKSRRVSPDRRHTASHRGPSCTYDEDRRRQIKTIVEDLPMAAKLAGA